jgi:hypothetical protein
MPWPCRRVIAEPPLPAGAVQVTTVDAVSDAAATEVGASGTVSGVADPGNDLEDVAGPLTRSVTVAEVSVETSSSNVVQLVGLDTSAYCTTSSEIASWPTSPGAVQDRATEVCPRCR